MNAKEIARLNAKDVNFKIGKAIKGICLREGVSQEHLGEALGVSYQQVQKYVSGVNRISAASLAVVAETLNSPIGDFYGVTMNGARHDTMIDFLSTPYAGELIEHYRALGNLDRDTVVRVARSLARGK